MDHAIVDPVTDSVTYSVTDSVIVDPVTDSVTDRGIVHYCSRWSHCCSPWNVVGG